MKEATLVFAFRGDEILLAMKKRGFGVGHWNGAGGKIQDGETARHAAIRETQEEIGITPELSDPIGRLTFRFPDGLVLLVNVWRTNEFTGELSESEEMRPQWFSVTDIPYEVMWDDDKIWLPTMLAGKKFEAEFWFDEHNKVARHTLKEK